MKARATDNDLIFESYNNPEGNSTAEQQLSEKEKKEKKWKPPLGYMRDEADKDEWEEELIARSKGFLPKDPEVVVDNAARRINNMQNNSYIQSLVPTHDSYTNLGKKHREKHATKFPNRHMGQSIDNHPEVDAVEDFIYDFMDNALDKFGRPTDYEFDVNKLRELVAAAEKDYPGTKDLPQLVPSLQKAITGDKGPETKDAAPAAQSGLDFARQQVAASELKQKPAAEAPAAGGEADEADTWWNSLSPEKKQQVVQLLRSS